MKQIAYERSHASSVRFSCTSPRSVSVSGIVRSCSIHYHRIHPVYWKDRLQRVQAMGLNTIEVSLVLLTQPCAVPIIRSGESPTLFAHTCFFNAKRM